jgi:tetratricopeptide (TPR) repeat protein
VIAAVGTAFTIAQQRAASSRTVATAPRALPAKARTLPTMAPAATATPAPTIAPAESATPEPASSPVPAESDDSDTPAPTCDQLLSNEAAKPRDALFAYDHVQEGHRELVRGNWDAAERAFCRAVREPDASPSTRFELAQALLFRRDSAAAAQQAREVLSAEPSSIRAQELLGDALVRTGASREACAIWLAASKLSASRMSQRDLFEAEQAAAQFDFARAERFYRRVVGCHPEHALAHAKLAATLAKLGQASAAQRWAQRALELAPDDLAVRASLPGNLR